MDDADRSAPNIESVVSDAVAKASRIAALIPPGNPGECDGCGEWSGRLVDGYCAPCRDKYARLVNP
jgi:hypothetical protein